MVPGDADQIRASRQSLLAYGENLVRIGEGLQDLDTGGWTGEAADRFHDYFDGEPTRWIASGDAFNAAAEAIGEYADCLQRAQGEAAEAIRLWDQGEAATKQAEQQHRQAVQAAAGGAAAEPFSDPGAPMREQASAVLQAARGEVSTSGDLAAAALIRAQQPAPEEPSLLEQIGDALEDFAETVGDIPGNIVHYGLNKAADVDQAIGAVGGLAIEGAGLLGGWASDVGGDVLGGAVSGAGELLGNETLELYGDVINEMGDRRGQEFVETTRDYGQQVAEDARTSAEHLREKADEYATALGAEPEEADLPQYVIVDEDRYPESAQHIEEAQDGLLSDGRRKVPSEPKPSELTIERAGADINRREALRGIPGRGKEGLDRDEYPPAVFAEGGNGASVKYIPASDNRGAGSSMGNQMRGLENGDRVKIMVG
ncbi:putative T7SS-secreted protein [Saccharopolyspora sp. NPDC002686]|uniref:putative T7SS-secreted protein n=1 Tax=Saccharopolyspora sp. NPDC002686 TaxID=3154541 RepID=UPI003329444C